MLRLVAVQFRSAVGEVAANIARADNLLGRIAQKDMPTVVVFPELALTGYAFGSSHAIRQFLEGPQGLTTRWARDRAQQYGVHIMIGYPEADAQRSYNTALLVDPRGDVLARYRKTHLYPADETWGCSQSPTGFAAFGPWPDLPYRVQLGICMDLNPYRFEAPFGDLEFANSVVRNRAQLVLCTMAWEETVPTWPVMAQFQPADPKLVEYWRMRVPLSVPIVYANQCGRHPGVTYGGSSTIWDGRSAASLGRGEGVLERVVTIPAD